MPADLDQPALFDKPDFIAFHSLVDVVITDVLGLNRAALVVGGDKGRQAAKLLGLF